MKRLSAEDRKWFIGFLELQIKEAEFNVLRYRTEDCYEQVLKLKRIYNILKYEADQCSN